MNAFLKQKTKVNKIKAAIESNKVYLTDKNYIEDAKKEIKYIKRECDGYTAIGLKDAIEKWVQWHIKNIDFLTVVPKLVKFKDIYISINSMLSPLRQLKNLRHLHAFWVDLDYYKKKIFKGKTTEEMVSILRDKGLFKEIEPSFFIDSGNGMYLFYLIESASVGALPIWQKIQNSFIKKFEKFGADPMSADAVHVLRLAGSENSKTGKRARFLYNSEKEFKFEIKKESIKVYEMKELAKIMLPSLPYSKDEWEKIRTAKRQTKKVKESKKELALFNLHTLHWARLQDIQTLQRLREGNCKGYRELMCFLYRYYNCLFLKNNESALINAIDFNSQFTIPLDEQEVIFATKSAEKAYEKWETTFSKYILLKEKPSISQYFRKEGCYIYSNKKLIKLLNITEEEMIFLSTIISTKEKNRRSKEYRNDWNKKASKKSRRNHNGLTSRQQSKLDNLVLILKLKKDGFKQKEIANTLGITQQAISKLFREYEKGEIDSEILNKLTQNNIEQDENLIIDIRDIAT